MESFGTVRRGMVVLKMRGSQHDPEIREYVIDGEGMHIRGPLEHVHGLLFGSPSHVDPELAQKIQTDAGAGSVD